MVLYYKKVEKEPEVITESHDIPAITSKTDVPTGPRPGNDKNIHMSGEIVNKLLHETFGNRKEMYYNLLEDDFNNLSIDDKLLIIYRSSIITNNTTNRYVLLCLVLLLIITLKLYSK